MSTRELPIVCRTATALVLTFCVLASVGRSWAGEEAARPRPALPVSHRLGAGQALLWVPAPHTPEREAWRRAAYPAISKSESLFIQWSGTPAAGGLSYVTGPVHLSDVCRAVLNLYPHEIEAPPEVLQSPVSPGDWVTDRSASMPKRAAALEEVSRTQLMLPLRFSVVEQERRVVVVRGEFRASDKPVELTDDASRAGAQHGAGQLHFEDFLKQVGVYLGRPVISEVKQTPEKALSYLVKRAALVGEVPPPADVPSTLKNLAAQTGLSFTEEPRRIRILRIQRD